MCTKAGSRLLDVWAVGGVYRSRRSCWGRPPHLQLLCIASTAGLGQNQTERLGHKHLWASLHPQRVSLVFPQCTDVWLFVCATTWIKNLRYSYSKNSFQDKQRPMYRTLEHTHTFICIRLWSLTLSLKGKLLFHPCFIDEATKIRKTCSKLIQLRALN